MIKIWWLISHTPGVAIIVHFWSICSYEVIVHVQRVRNSDLFTSVLPIYKYCIHVDSYRLEFFSYIVLIADCLWFLLFLFFASFYFRLLVGTGAMYSSRGFSPSAFHTFHDVLQYSVSYIFKYGQYVVAFPFGRLCIVGDHASEYNFRFEKNCDTAAGGLNQSWGHCDIKGASSPQCTNEWKDQPSAHCYDEGDYELQLNLIVATHLGSGDGWFPTNISEGSRVSRRPNKYTSFQNVCIGWNRRTLSIQSILASAVNICQADPTLEIFPCHPQHMPSTTSGCQQTGRKN